jgi:hypothetical protein
VQARDDLAFNFVNGQALGHGSAQRNPFGRARKFNSVKDGSSPATEATKRAATY